MELLGMTVWRRASLPPLLLAATLALSGCSRSEEPDARTEALDPERQRVLEFWKLYNAARRVRTGGDCAEAVPLYEKALELDPSHGDSLYYLGQCRRELGQPGPAREALERLVEINPASARGHLALGALLASPDPAEPMDLGTAERHLRRAHEINGEETGPVVRLGEVALAAGRPEEARIWLEAALQTNAKSVEAALLAGYIAFEAAGGGDAGPFADPVREAARIEAPVKGVASKGDRQDTRGRAARPLSHPLGRLLFGGPVDALRSRAAAGESLSDDDVLEAWREVRRLCREYEARS
jgi:tetratricopeptide (TPR) repeat protein